MHTHKKHLIFFALFVCVFAVLNIVNIPVAEAQAPTRWTLGEDALQSSGMWANILTALNVMAWIAFNTLDTLLDPNFIFNSFDGGSQVIKTMRQVWVVSRNIVNIVFAVGFLMAALFTTIKADLSMVKENMGKFVLAVVLVNFSWLFPRMAIDAANILTAVIYSLPNDIVKMENCEVPDGKTGKSKPCEIVSNVGILLDSSAEPGAIPNDTCETPKSQKKAEECGFDCSYIVVCIKKGTWDSVKDNPQKQILHGLVYNYAHLGDLDRLPTAAPSNLSKDNIGGWVMYIIRMFIVIFMHIALIFPLMALCLAFLMRIPVLWLTAAFMPFFFVGFIMETAKVPGVDATKSILSEFMKAAFLPAITALPLTIGFIMMNSLSGIGWDDYNDQLKGGLNLTAGITTHFDLIWMACALGIMWAGTFMALEKAGIAGKFGGYFKALGESIGKFAGSVALAAPIIPKIGGMNMLQLGQALSRPQQTLSQLTRNGDPLREIRERRARGDSLAPAPILHAPVRIEEYKAKPSESGEPIQKAAEAAAKDPTGAKLKPLIDKMQEVFNKADAKAGDHLTVNDNNFIQHLKELDREKVIRIDDVQMKALEDALAKKRAAATPVVPPTPPTTPPPAPGGGGTTP